MPWGPLADVAVLAVGAVAVFSSCPLVQGEAQTRAAQEHPAHDDCGECSGAALQLVQLGHLLQPAAAETVKKVDLRRREWDLGWTVFHEKQTERKRTMLLSSLLPFGVMILLAVLTLWFLSGHVGRNTASESSRSIYLVVTLVLMLNYSIVILDSYDLCRTLGLSQAESGRMVGIMMPGTAVGSAALWLLQRWRPQLWKERPRAPLLGGFLFELLGAVLYCWVAVQGTNAAGRSRSTELPPGVATPLFGLGDKPWLSHTLMLSRFLMGIGSGSCQQFSVNSMLHITPVEERTQHSSRYIFVGMVGLGGGPLVAAALLALDLGQPGPRFDLVGYAQVFAVLTTLTSIAMLPDLERVTDCLESPPSPRTPRTPRAGTTDEGEQTTFENGKEAQPQTGSPVLILATLAMTGLRAFGVAATEVALALKLEQTYSWDMRATGLATGAVFLCCIPAKALHSVWSSSLTVPAWVRLFSGLSIVGSLLLFSWACGLLNFALGLQCSAVLIAAGVFLFPCFFMSDAFGSSLMHQHVMPEGSLLDANHVQLWFMVSVSVGRFTGPWLARLTLQEMGQDAFAVEQLAITVLFLLIFELVAKPFISPQVWAALNK